MSEPSDKLDLNSLSDALEVGATEEDPTKQKDAEEKAREVMNKSNTLTSNDKGSPQTLSPNDSPKGQQNADLTDSSAPAVAPAPLDPTTQQIKSMFPDLDVDTIQAVVVAEGGDFESAINTLLQMSDPSYVPPPPFKQNSQTDHDEQLARSLAEAEQEGAQRQFVPPSGRAGGGGLGSFFGLTGQDQNPQRPVQNYDANNLAYQPRVRRTPSGQTPPQRQTFTEDPSHAQQTNIGGIAPVSLPGPREAKQWQEDINKLAETGFAKAASTFSALRQRGEQAWANRAQNASPSAQSADPNGQRGGSFFTGWNNQRNAGSGSHSVVSPTIGSDRGFDRDPSPVGDNELAKILARGRSSGSDERGNGKSANISDRYKQVIANQRDNIKAKRAGGRHEDDVEDDDALGWDDAGRTNAKGGKAQAADADFQPIKIADNSGANTPIESAKTGQRNTVSLLDKSADKNPLANVQSQQQDDDDDDDLEYVANPFEDDD